jgi:hypothetical protein
MRASWQLLRQDKHLLLFPFLSGLCCLMIFSAFVFPALLSGGEPVGDTDPSIVERIAVPSFLFIFYFSCYLIITFFNSAVVASAAKRMQGEAPTLAYGFQAAFACLPLIAGWALVMATVGVMLSLAEAWLGRIGKLIVRFLDFSWVAVSFLVVPILVIEKKSPLTALQDSSGLLKKTWGQGVLCNFNFNFLLLLCSLPALVLLIIGSASGTGKAWALCLSLAIIYVLVLIIIQAALKGVFQAALYYYARHGLAPNGFHSSKLRAAMAGRQ